MSEEPTTAAVQRYLNALAGDASAEPIVREPPNSASPRHPLTGWTGLPRDRCRDDPTLVCVTRKPSREAARPRGRAETAGPFEPNTHFSRRLDRVAPGEEIASTKRSAEGQAGHWATSSRSDTGSTPKARWRPCRSAR